jgi:F-type H+-transporting ATPase subunit gamma
MRRPSEIEKDEKAMQTLVELTSAFEGIASMKIAQIKNQVLQATQFFDSLWGIYTQIRVSAVFGYGRSDEETEIIDRELYIIITAEGGFSGDIDQKLIELMLKTYDKEKNEIIVIGHHGAIQLAQRGVSYKKYFKLPNRDRNINVTPIINEVQKYKSTVIYYQEYVSLSVQDVKRIDLSAAVTTQGKKSGNPEDLITEMNYIFEPSTFAVVDYLERTMMYIAVSQLILNSKLAQYASRFRAMTASHQRSEEEKADLHLAYNRSKRAIKDQRLKEIISGMKMMSGAK